MIERRRSSRRSIILAGTPISTIDSVSLNTSSTM